MTTTERLFHLSEKRREREGGMGISFLQAKVLNQNRITQDRYIVRIETLLSLQALVHCVRTVK